jgi:hypothetical protein
MRRKEGLPLNDIQKDRKIMMRCDMILGLRREFLRQQLEAPKDNPSASKTGLRNNIFRDTTNCHRDNIKVIHKSEASKSCLRSNVLRDTTNCHRDNIKVIHKSEASKSCLRNNVLRDTTNCHRDSIKAIQKSEAVNKRKAELEQLRRRSLTKDIGKETKKSSQYSIGVFLGEINLTISIQLPLVEFYCKYDMAKPPKPLDCGTPRHPILTILQNGNEKAIKWRRPNYRKQKRT